MKGLQFFLLAALLVITSSCNNHGTKELTLKNNVKHIIFISNDSDYTKEAPYYDALIELKKSFPAEIKNMIVFSPAKAKEYYKTYKINTFPALLVIYNSKVLVNINGTAATKEEIIQPVSEVLSREY